MGELEPVAEIVVTPSEEHPAVKLVNVPVPELPGVKEIVMLPFPAVTVPRLGALGGDPDSTSV